MTICVYCKTELPKDMVCYFYNEQVFCTQLCIEEVLALKPGSSIMINPRDEQIAESGFSNLTLPQVLERIDKRVLVEARFTRKLLRADTQLIIDMLRMLVDKPASIDAARIAAGLEPLPEMHAGQATRAAWIDTHAAHEHLEREAQKNTATKPLSEEEQSIANAIVTITDRVVSFNDNATITYRYMDSKKEIKERIIHYDPAHRPDEQRLLALRKALRYARLDHNG